MLYFHVCTVVSITHNALSLPSECSEVGFRACCFLPKKSDAAVLWSF